MFSSKKSVMVIDDDLGRRKKVYDVLKITGFDIFSASTGQEAMGRLPREKPRMVIVNTSSAAVDGIEFIRNLRTYGMGQKMIVVALCDDGDEKGLREKSMSADADTVLPEDFTPYSLVELVSEKLGIDKVVIAKDEFDKRREVVDRLAESYRERKKSAKSPPPKVQVMLPDGRDLGLLLLTDDAGKGC